MSPLYSGTVANNGSQLVAATALPTKTSSVSLALSSAYTATAGTTGVKVQVSASIDDGASYSDYADLATTAPTPSSGSPISSQVYASLSAYAGATHLKFNLKNLDATNTATVVLTLRAAA